MMQLSINENNIGDCVMRGMKKRAKKKEKKKKNKKKKKDK
jgi:hypothetical protein